MAENKKSSIGGKSTCHLLNVKQPERTNKRIKLSFQRVHVQLMVLKKNRAVEASMGLLDLSETGAGVFTQELLIKGSTVELCVTEPRTLKIKGIVAWSVPIQSGLPTSGFAFRSGMQFVFENEVQRTALLDFLKKVNMDPLESMRANMAAASTTTPAPVAEAAAAPTPAVAEAPAATPAEAPVAEAAASEVPKDEKPPSEGEGGGQSQAA